jgi:glycosyltransferase involved in cell wall biosynthesis
MMPLVSVIVPTHNSSRYLDRCLSSVLAQSYQPIELIVVDNHSTDATLGIACRYTQLVYEWGPERSAQVNFGVKRASGEYVYKVDSDFVLEPDVIASCVDVAATGADAIVVHNSPDVSVGWIARLRKFEVDMYKGDLTHSSARFVKKTVYESMGGFNEAITAGEDYDFQNRLTKAGYVTGFIDPEAVHLGEPTNLWKHLVKYFEYGKGFAVYRAANPVASKHQLQFVRNVYLRNWRRFFRHPLLGGKFVIYSALKFGFGAAGLAAATLKPLPVGRGKG